MSIKELESQVQALSPDKLEQFCRWLDDYRAQMNAREAEIGENLSEECKAELLRRVEFAKSHPEALEPWEGTTNQIRQRLDAARKKTPPGRS